MKTIDTKILQELVVYTAIFGDYDILVSPKFVPKEVTFICFTDNPKLESDVWKIIPCKKTNFSSRHKARMIKVLPHLFLSNYTYSLWVDANLTITGDITKLYNRYYLNHKITLFKHPHRNCIYKEASACIRTKKDNRKIIEKQMQKYKSMNYPNENGLIESGIIFRKHNDSQVKQIMDNWWLEIIQHSIRDQLSFNFVAWKHKFSFNIINENLRDTEFFELRKHLL